jgi:WD40 repeat protein
MRITRPIFLATALLGALAACSDPVPPAQPPRAKSASDPARAELALQTRHWGRISAAALSPDGTALATVADDGKVKIWDVASGQVRRTMLTPHPITSVAFAFDGRKLAHGSVTGATVWDARTGAQLFATTRPGSVWAIAFARTRNLLAVGWAGGPIEVWDVDAKKLHVVLAEQADRVGEIAFSPNDDVLYATASDGKVKAWAVQSGALLRQWAVAAESFEPPTLALSPAGDVIATGSEEGTVKLWAAGTGTLQRSISGVVAQTNAVAFAPDGRSLLVGNTEVKLHAVDTGALVTTFERRLTLSKAVFHAAPNTFVASIGQALTDDPADTEVVVWDVASAKALRGLNGYRTGVSSVASVPAQKAFATSQGKNVSLWSLETGTKTWAMTMDRDVRALTLSPDDKTLAVATGGVRTGGSVVLADVASGKVTRSFEGFSRIVREAVFSPTGGRLVSCSEDGTLRVWNAATWVEQKTIATGPLPVYTVVLARDAPLAYAGLHGGSIAVVNLETGTVQQTWKALRTSVHALALSPDGKLLASGGKNSSEVTVWDMADGAKLKATVKDARLSAGKLKFVSPSALAASNANGLVLLMNLGPTPTIREVSFHELAATSLELLPDGRNLLTASDDRTLHLVNIESGHRVMTFYDPSPDVPANFVTIDAEGFYVASPAAETLTLVRTGLDLRPLVDLHATHFQPDRIAQGLARR